MIVTYGALTLLGVLISCKGTPLSSDTMTSAPVTVAPLSVELLSQDDVLLLHVVECEEVVDDDVGVWFVLVVPL